jgi:hypothetical protein
LLACWDAGYPLPSLVQQNELTFSVFNNIIILEKAVHFSKLKRVRGYPNSDSLASLLAWVFGLGEIFLSELKGTHHRNYFASDEVLYGFHPMKVSGGAGRVASDRYSTKRESARFADSRGTPPQITIISAGQCGSLHHPACTRHSDCYSELFSSWHHITYIQYITCKLQVCNSDSYFLLTTVEQETTE